MDIFFINANILNFNIFNLKKKTNRLYTYLDFKKCLISFINKHVVNKDDPKKHFSKKGVGCRQIKYQQNTS